MRLKILLFAISLLVGESAFSQESKWSFGVRGGLNLSTMSLDNITSSSRVGYNIGAVVEYALPQNFFLQSGLQVSSKGTRGSDFIDTESFGAVKAHNKLNTTYLQLPLSVGYRQDITKDLSLHYTFGGYLSQGTGGHFESKASYAAQDGYFNYEYTHKIYHFDAGLTASIGLEYQKAILVAGYDYGLTNVMKNNSFAHGYMRNAFISVGYRIF